MCRRRQPLRDHVVQDLRSKFAQGADDEIGVNEIRGRSARAQQADAGHSSRMGRRYAGWRVFNHRPTTTIPNTRNLTTRKSVRWRPFPKPWRCLVEKRCVFVVAFWRVSATLMSYRLWHCNHTGPR